MNTSDEAARQRLLARFLDDPAFEAELRADPRRVAAREGVREDEGIRLAAIEPARVAAFRASRVHKDRLRSGRKKPSRLEG